MRILQLYLKAFGPFHEVRLDFQPDSAGLHLIYGDNEAGKTSALRGLTGALFGFDRSCSYSFRHAYRDYRVGLLVRSSDGIELEFLRHKANKNSLRAADDAQVIPDERLEKLLQGLNREAFRQRFGLTREELVEGGRSLTQGQGDVGEALFAAAGGLSRLHAARDQLTAAAANLYTPRSRNRTINALLSELKEQQAKTQAAKLQPSVWAGALEQRDQLDKALAKTERELSESATELTRLRRIQSAATFATQWETQRRALAELAGVPNLAADFTTRRHDAQTGRKLAAEQIQSAEKELHELADRLAALEPATELFDRRKEIERLYGEVANYQRIQVELPQQSHEREQFEQEALRALARAGRQIALAEVPQLLDERDAALVARITELAQQRGALEQEALNASLAEKKLASLIEKLQQEADGQSPPPDTTALEAAIRQVRPLGNLDTAALTAQRQAAALHEQAQTAVARLPGWHGDLEAIERLALSPEAAIQAAVTQWQDDDETTDELQRECRILDDEARRLDAKVSELRKRESLPAPGDLPQARTLRDELLSQLVSGWQQGEPFDGQVVDKLAAAIRNADAIADRMYAAADRIAELSNLMRQQEHNQVERKARHDQFAAHTAAVAQRREKWNQQCHALGIEPLTPAAMLEWCRQRKDVLDRIEAWRAAQQAEKQAADQLAQQRQRIASLAAECGAPPAAETDSLTEQLDRAEALVERARHARQELAQANQRLSELREALAEQRSTSEQARQAFDQWQQQWAEATRGLVQHESPLPAEVTAILNSYQEAEKQWRLAAEKRSRCEEMERYLEQLEQRARSLAAAVAADLANEPLGAILVQLHQRLAEADRREAERNEVQQQHKRCQSKLEQAQHERLRHQSVLEQLCHEAGVEQEDQLPAIEQQAAQRRQAEEKYKELEEGLAGPAAGQPIEQLLAEVHAEAIDSLPVRIQELEARIEPLRNEARELSNQLALANRNLADWDGRDDQAAQLHEQMQATAARLSEQADEFARQALAAAALKLAIERYRQRHQGPVVSRASGIFRQLTLGSFDGLLADELDGKPVLFGLRPGGRITVDGMSEGTCDQLYLALRLASLEQHVDQHGPFPLILDDVLVMSDNDRAAAALTVLAELSRKTQVILFTHHEHLVRLAKDHVAAELLAVHEIDWRESPESARPTAP